MRMKTKRIRFPERARRSRKAQAETQLNWIFILIVGALILAFFSYIVIKQRAASEVKFAGKIGQQLNTIFTGAKVASGTVQEIPTPEVSIRFDCNDYYIGPTSQRMGNRVIFAPEYVEGTKIITWTRDWSVPFKVSSFLYVTAPTVKYVVVGAENDPEAKEIYDDLPDKINKALVSVTDYGEDRLINEDDPYVRFILVDVSTMMIPDAFSDVEVTGLSVDTASKKAGFLVRSAQGDRFNPSEGQYDYVEDEVLYGAIFSDNPKEYECVMERAYSRFNIVSNVYYERLNAIASDFEGSTCEGYYKNNININTLMTATEVYPPRYEDLASAKESLKESNTRLQLYSCPLIY